MAIAEHEVTQELSIRLNREQQNALCEAASAAGQSLEDFAAATLLRAADAAREAPPALLSIPQTGDPLDRIAGIFRDEPLMDALMERIREDRRVEIEAIEAEIEAEAVKAGASG